MARQSYLIDNELIGQERSLPPLSSSGQWRMAMDSSDSTLKVSVDGAAYTAIGGGGGGSSLNASYLVGNQIDLIDAVGPFVLDNGQTFGEALLISSSAAPTLTAPFTGIQIDMSGIDPDGQDLTGLNIDLSGVVPGASLIRGVVVTGPTTSKAKVRGQALVSINSRYSAATTQSILVRNKSATAGSLVLVGWDSTNYEGALNTNSVLDDTTHMVTLDGQTWVTPGTEEFMALKILVPDSSATTTAGVDIRSTQIGSLSSGIFMLMAPSSSAPVRGMTISMSTNTAIGGSAITTNWGSTAGCAGAIRSRLTSASPNTQTMVLFNADTSSVTTGALIVGYQSDFASTVSGAFPVVGFSSVVPASTSTSTRAFWGQSLQRAGEGIYMQMTASSSSTAKGFVTDMSSSSGLTGMASQLIWRGTLGGVISNISAQLGGTFNPAVATDALTFMSIGADTALTMGTNSNLNGIIINLSTNILTPQNHHVRPLTLFVPDSSVSTSNAIYASSASPGANVFQIDWTPASGSTSNNAINITLGSNVRRTAFLTDGYAAHALINATLACGYGVTIRNITGSNGDLWAGAAYYANRDGTIFNTDQCYLMTLNYTPTHSGGGSAIGNNVPYLAYINNAAVFGFNSTNTMSDFAVIRATSRSSGTVSQSGALIRAVHTSSGTMTDTSIGVYVTMTPATAQAVVGQLITMGPNATSHAASFSHTGTGLTTSALSVGMVSQNSGGSIARFDASPTVATACNGITLTMGSNARGTAFTIDHAGTGGNSNHLAFTSGVDGTGAHIYGPVGSNLVVKAGSPSVSASGRGITMTASDANTSGDGGSIGLYPGNGAGGGSRGTLALCGSTTDVLQFFGAGGSAKLTISGSRADPEQALADLLTGLSDYGLITDSTTA